MAAKKGVDYDRIDLPGGGWLLLYKDGRIKVAKYNATMKVHEVLNRKGGAHVFITVTDDPPAKGKK